jgi:hypothetical protein
MGRRGPRLHVRHGRLQVLRPQRPLGLHLHLPHLRLERPLPELRRVRRRHRPPKRR